MPRLQAPHDPRPYGRWVPREAAGLTHMDEFRSALDLSQARGRRDLETARAYAGGAQEAFTREASYLESHEEN
ncbi:hypothetical protein F5X96DRAFT_673687 [Biscogniauxia mediterranea]|nr:hypothetical protein F5X96DRAFT_673687 [Biscogniauxia mediterranea]